MTAYNKLRLAILAILASQSAAAITLQPLKVMSSSGELLYAEMNFSRADVNTPLEVGLASTNELQQLGINSQAPSGLSFYTRRTGPGNGVIVITSSRPLNDSNLNIVLKVKEGDNTRIQQIKAPLRSNSNSVTSGEKPLTPQYVVSEKDIALNLPQSTQYNTASDNLAATAQPVPATEHPLATSSVQPPALNSASNSAISVQAPTISTTTTVANTQPNTVTATKTSSNLTIQVTRRDPNSPAPKPMSEVAFSASTTTPPPATATKTPDAEQPIKVSNKSKQRIEKESQKAKVNSRYTVKHHDTLWAIASRIAAQTKEPVTKVMQRLLEQNEQAFVNGDANRLRQGIALNLAATNMGKSKDKSTRNPKTSTVVNNAPIPSNKAKIKLKEAELKLVAENEKSGARDNAQKVSSGQGDSALASKITESRQTALKLQKQVSGLELGLGQKDQRIQLLNARLAQMQQQLKQQQELAQKATKTARS